MFTLGGYEMMAPSGPQGQVIQPAVQPMPQPQQPPQQQPQPQPENQIGEPFTLALEEFDFLAFRVLAMVDARDFAGPAAAAQQALASNPLLNTPLGHVAEGAGASAFANIASTPPSNLQTLTDPPANTYGVMVPVMKNSAPTVLDLDAIFAEQSGLQLDDGLQWTLLSNTNPGLVTPELSGSDLTLAYTPGQWGLASLSLGATDADGVSARENINVVARPWAT
jgi:hypothetical protein